MGTDPLFVRYTNNIEDNSVLRTELFLMYVIVLWRSDDKVSHKLIFFLIQDGLFDHNWLFADS